MPEGDTIFRAARTLHRALAGRTITHFESVLPKLTRVDVDKGVCGRIVERVEAQGKWLRMHLSGDLTLLTHMLMSGSWCIYRPGERWRLPYRAMRVLVGTEHIVAVGFNIQVAEFHTEESLRRRTGLSTLGLVCKRHDSMKRKRRAGSWHIHSWKLAMRCSGSLSLPASATCTSRKSALLAACIRFGKSRR